MSEHVAKDRGDLVEAGTEALTRGVTREDSHASVPREIRGSEETGVHPSVVKIILGATAWFLIVTWMSFAWGGEVDLNLTIAILFFIFFLGLFLFTASYSFNDPRWHLRETSFREFLDSDVGTATGRMRGRDVLIEIATVPVSLALAATVIGVIWVAIHWSA
jgi:hypothetical protein